MIIKWEIIGAPAPQHPNRHRVNIKCDNDDLKKVIDFYGKKCGTPWKAKNKEYDFSFYIYNVTDRDVESFNDKIKEFQAGGNFNSSTGTKNSPEKQNVPATVPFFHDGVCNNVSPAVPVIKEPAKRTSGVVDFDVFEPNKINAVEIKKSGR